MFGGRIGMYILGFFEGVKHRQGKSIEMSEWMDGINDNIKNEDRANSLDSFWVNNFTTRFTLIAQPTCLAKYFSKFK